MSIRINGDNTAANPGITGADTDTGLSFGTNEVSINTDGTERFRVGSSGELGIGGATYGTSGQVLTSQGSGSAPQWSTIASDSITEGNTSVEVVDTGSNGHITFDTEGTEAARFDSSGRLLVGTSTAHGNNQLQITPPGDSTNPYWGAISLRSNYSNVGTLGSSHILGRLDFAASDGGVASRIEGQFDTSAGTNDYPGRLVFSTAADGSSSPTGRMYIKETGRIGINASNPQGYLEIYPQWVSPNTSRYVALILRNPGQGNVAQFFADAGSQVGNINVTASATAYNTSSDYRLKENVVPLTGAADRLNQLQVRRFNFIAEPDTTVDGFIAHEAQAVVPEAVTGTYNEVEVWKEHEELPDGVSVGDNKLDEDGNTIPVYQGIDQAKLVPLLTAALQEALAKIETLETRLTALEGGTN